ncbi:MAG: F/Y rich C-terminus-domain-containing protein [Benjaminiella poitrasii]|nr:MAG: F/Y rich C-terminus-domain-containing protein [Benjaminiella poitrasii]
MANPLSSHSLVRDTKTVDTGIFYDFSEESIETFVEELLKKNDELHNELEKALLKITRLRKQRSALLDIIVKSSKNNEEDDDDDDIHSELSAGDIDSDVESTTSEDLDTIIKKEDIKQDYNTESSLQPLKRKRATPNKASKRQRGSKPVFVPKDDKGNYILPAVLGKTKVLSLGEIIPKEGFFNQNYIFPVGYAIERPYKSMVNKEQFTTYKCSISKDEYDKPLFCIEAEDAPEIEIKKNTPTAAWSEVLRKSNLLRQKEFKNTVSGPEYYGLSSITIKKMIQELPGARDCIGYQWMDI